MSYDDETRELPAARDPKGSGFKAAVLSKATPVRIQLGLLIAFVGSVIIAAGAWYNFQGKFDRQAERFEDLTQSVKSQTEALSDAVRTLHGHDTSITLLKNQQDNFREDLRDLKRRLEKAEVQR